MISSYFLEDLKLRREESINKDSLEKAIWIDLIDASENDRHFIEQTLNINFASKLELEDIEASARFFEDEYGLHLHSFFFYEDEDEYADLETVAFTIKNEQLYSIRTRELTPFRLYRLRSLHQKLTTGNAYEVLLDIFETKIEQIADLIEDTYASLEVLTRKILLSNNGSDLDVAIEELTYFEDLTSKINTSIMDTNRALSFLLRKTRLPNDLIEQARDIFRDIESIKPNNDLLFTRISFLMDASMGLINIEQNRIIKMFSVMSVIFLPPTLVASMYGMNFEIMPELHWKYGYPYAIVFMILSAVICLCIFKWRKWL
ncbi:magnesium/cobalt transporter CorA [Psittacicella hinzii]|uniref:Magnesium transport protein CorA n=1 Tax=Psittacicella hinzii TaxID=2028575 RepID=A0A3A1YBG1_9GAMM|nr:magnesium/cobalt transporter CorA [Psittacicella hinzii]RIY34901.1 magnesium and cobalt transport protein CorA [Psittacicella hinzii]